MSGPAATLYVIPGSHACRTGILMLEHKGIPYRTVELVTGVHPFALRALGFAGHREPIRTVEGRTHGMLALLDRAGTVPALRIGEDRIQTNREIARYLDRMQPDPPLFPSDPARRAQVEEAERWADDVLQMAARRVVLAAGLDGLDGLHNRGGEGRLGALLAPNPAMRAFSNRVAAITFRAKRRGALELSGEVPALLDRIDGWLSEGVLGGEQLTAADYSVAASLALLTYRPDLRPGIAARPAGALVDRVLPEPTEPARAVA